MRTLLLPALIALFPFISHAQCWELVFRVPGNPDLNDVYFANATTGWTVGNTGIIYKTTDGGLTWAVQPVPTTNDLNAVHFINVNELLNTHILSKGKLGHKYFRF